MDTKPRSKANFLPPDYARIKGRIDRLQACIAKHEARGDDPKSQAKIAACKESIANYKQLAKDTIASLSELAGD